MAQQRMKRVRILAGEHAGKVVEGFDIGSQDFPDQFKTMTHEQILESHKNGEGVWIPELNCCVKRTKRITSLDVGATVNYGGYEDLAIPFDGNNKEIFIGDELYIAVKNEVRRAKVTKIFPEATFASYGIINRKIGVQDEDGTKLTINDTRATIKIGA